MTKLYCALLPSGCVFSVDISYNEANAGDLYHAVANMWSLSASQLQLFVANERANAISARFDPIECTQSALRGVIGLSGEELQADSDVDDVDGSARVHVLMEVLGPQVAEKRIPVDDWFPQELRASKRQKWQKSLVSLLHLSPRARWENGLAPIPVGTQFWDEFHRYCWEAKECWCVESESEVRLLREEKHVLRLVDGHSSSLVGWKGVSVLFAVPGFDGLNEFAKVNSFRYILPVWALEELRGYNSLLDGRLRLSDDVLTARYDKFGGIPRFIFAATELGHGAALHQVIQACSALDIIQRAKSGRSVREANSSVHVLQVVPDRSDCRALFHLEFLSEHIAKQVAAAIRQSDLKMVSKAVIAPLAHADSVSERASPINKVRDKMYELLCHRWLTRSQQRTLHFRSLCPQSSGGFELKFPTDLEIIRFHNLDDVTFPPDRLTCYQPRSSRTFDALSAYIVDPIHSKCYGLQMTLEAHGGVNVKPIQTFLEWLGSDFEFYYGFVVPSSLEPRFSKQTVQSSTDSPIPGADLPKLEQFVAPCDPFQPKNWDCVRGSLVKTSF
ncbi:hypothetical protein FI667_g6802, partial [Globisporangium splendens]